MYYQSQYQNDGLQKIVALGAPSDFKIIMQNYIDLLSLNSKMAKHIENYYLEYFNFKIDDFSSKVFASKIQTKGFVAHDIDDNVVLFEEGKKIATTLEKCYSY